VKSGRPVWDLAEYPSGEPTRIYQINTVHRQTGYYYYYPQAPVRQPKQIPHETETITFAADERYSLGSTGLEKKNEEEQGMRIPHNTIYRILLEHRRVNVCMKKRKIEEMGAL
jgi:hypothetical protein